MIVLSLTRAIFNKDYAASVEARLWKKKKKLSSEKAINAGLKKKLDDALDRVNRAKERATLVEANALKAVDDYKKSATFEKKVTKASAVIYHYGFDDYKDNIA